MLEGKHARSYLLGVTPQRLRTRLERRGKRGRQPPRLHVRLEEVRVQRARAVGRGVAQGLGMTRRCRLPRRRLLRRGLGLERT